MSRTGIPRGIEFLLAKSMGSESWYWSVFIPTQLTKVKTREEAEANLAKVISNIRKGKLVINERDFNSGKNIDYVGGLGHLLEKYELDQPVRAPRRNSVKPAKRVSKKSKVKSKRKLSKPAKRIQGKKVRVVRKGTVPRLQRHAKRGHIRPVKRKLRIRTKRKKG